MKTCTWLHIALYKQIYIDLEKLEKYTFNNKITVRKEYPRSLVAVPLIDYI